MLYINNSKEKKLVPINRSKRWMNPGEIIDLSAIDARFIGSNSGSIEPYIPMRRMKKKKKLAKVQVKVQVKSKK